MALRAVKLVMSGVEGGGQTDELDVVKVVEELVGVLNERMELRRYRKLESFIGGGGLEKRWVVGERFGELVGKLDGLAFGALVGLAAMVDLAVQPSRGFLERLSGRGRSAWLKIYPKISCFPRRFWGSGRDG